MIRYIRGKLAMVEGTSVVVDNQGIGYRILVPQSLLEKLPAPGSEITIYTFLNVREDAMQLFGFETMDDLEIFQQLITVSGIGPKGGLNILSILSADDIRFAVLSDDARTIARAPGIGIKTAKKLIVELKDKLDAEAVIERSVGREDTRDGAAPQSRSMAEAAEALSVLGYPAAEALKAVRQVEGADQMTTEELLKQALRKL